MAVKRGGESQITGLQQVAVQTMKICFESMILFRRIFYQAYAIVGISFD